MRWIFLCLTLLPISMSYADELVAVDAIVSAFHQAATSADEQAYLSLQTDDVVFLGTDATERWQGKNWREFVHDNFSRGRGWEYKSFQRQITLTDDGKAAWFDELLSNEHLGTCRGSGVLIKTPSGWKLAQYNLSMPVPNELVFDVASRIAAEAQNSDLPKDDQR